MGTLCVLTALSGTVPTYATDRTAHAAWTRARMLAERSRQQLRLQQIRGIRKAEITRQEAASTTDAILGDQVVPYIVQGHGWSTSLELVNTCSESSHYLIRFYDSAGNLKELYTGNESGNRYVGIRSGDDHPVKGASGWYFPDTGDELLQAHGRFLEDNNGCITGTAEYFIEDGDSFLSAETAFQRISDGWVVPFANFQFEEFDLTCQTAYSIAGMGDTLTLDAYSRSGDHLKTAVLGNVHHEVFAFSDHLAGVDAGLGVMKIRGSSVVVGLSFCNGKLEEASLFAFPLGTAEQLPWTTAFDIKHTGSHQYLLDTRHQFLATVTIHNPNRSARRYKARIVFTDEDGFTVGEAYMLSTEENQSRVTTPGPMPMRVSGESEGSFGGKLSVTTTGWDSQLDWDLATVKIESCESLSTLDGTCR